MGHQIPETAALRGASILIVLQVGSRLLSFLANQALLRFLTARQLGLATQLEVYYLSVLFFARESIRVAIQRVPSVSPLSLQDDNTKSGRGVAARAATISNNPQSIINLAFIPPALSVLLAPLLAIAYHGSLPASTLAQTPSLTPALSLYALASVIELLAEPGFALAQARLRFGVRARAEAAATLGRCAATLVCVVGATKGFFLPFSGPVTTATRADGNGSGEGDVGIFPFALGQLVYAVILLVVYTFHAHKSAFSSSSSSPPGSEPGSKSPLAPRRIAHPDFWRGYLHRPTLALASSMAAQSVVKHVLTQGDTFLVSVLSTPTAQGVYALVNNYGGLLARTVFQPVEESSRTYFSRLLSADSPGNAREDAAAHGSDPKSKGREEDDRHSAQASVVRDNVVRAAADLQTLLKALIVMSSPVYVLGPAAATPLLAVVAGPRWVSAGAGSALAAYCHYVPLLAVNGITEAFVSSVATKEQVHAQSVWMGMFSIVFAAAGFVALRILDWGADGLVAANAVNMACRILWSVWFIARYFSARGVRFDLSSLKPATALIVAGALTRGAIKGAVGVPGSPITALVEIVVASVPFLGTLLYTERQFLLHCFHRVRGGRATAQANKDK